MNPPSSLHGAMGRERKPFTYTPGGLDLSEIKSERMAKRLMRNAMNQGVPELPPQVLSPTTPTTPIAVPNFNALPVQVFPAFNLPANPKSLLRTRSTPDRHREPPAPRQAPIYKPPAPVPNYNNTDRPTSMYELGATPTTLPRTSYGSDAHAPPEPVMCYDAEYCQAVPKSNNGLDFLRYDAPAYTGPGTDFLTKDNTEQLKTDFSIEPITKQSVLKTETTPCEDIGERLDDDQKTVRIVKKQVKTAEKKVESETPNQNGDKNGDEEVEMVVKLPNKSSAAKTETKVEVVKKVLPDGSVEEKKTTITTTTVDGKTSVSTKTETQVIPKEPNDDEEVEEEEEEEEEEEIQENGQSEKEAGTVAVVSKTVTKDSPEVKQSVIRKEERSETTTTKKVVVTQQDEEPEETEEETEQQTVTITKNKTEEKTQNQDENQVILKEKIEEKTNEVKKENAEVKGEKDSAKETQKPEEKTLKVESTDKEEEEEEEEVDEEEEEFEEIEEKPVEKPVEKPESKSEKPSEPIKVDKEDKSADEESEYTEEEYESEQEEVAKTGTAQPPKPAPVAAPEPTPATTAQPSNEETEKPPVKLEGKTSEEKPHESAPESKSQPVPPQATPATNIPPRERSIPLEIVEDVEIKPIGGTETISKTHTERTEIITSDKPQSGLSSTQTEFNRIENIVNVTRTTKTLDHSYEQITQQGIPTVKTYFPPGRERVSTSPQPARPYQSTYTPPQPQPPTERRHSLLLERLSMERQMPSDIYQKQTSYQQQYNNQNYEQQRQWSQEPQSEVVNDPNVKPSKITNQQWYQQSRKENVIYNNVAPSTPAVPSQQWNQPQPQVYQPPVQPQPQYQTPYIDNTLHETSKFSTNSYQQSSYPSYAAAPAQAATPAPAPNNWATHNAGTALPNVNTQSNQYSFLNKSSSENYQNQQYSSSYVPPPWEQSPNYVAPELPSQHIYQSPPSTNTFSPSSKPASWKPTPPAAGKFSKPAPKAYIPPSPNQSFVKSATPTMEPPKRPGCKTYYSEYERRYITVPESTYVPADARFQAQPDPTPQYYYDNNEPGETVEHQWRKELREFTEKTQTQTQNQMHTQTTTQNQHVIEQTSVHPPWEENSKYSKAPTAAYTPTPSWSQTVRPPSTRARSFESEYTGSKEWSKTNTLGRNRPMSSYAGSNLESHKCQTPMTIPYDTEHAPVQAHVLDPKHPPHKAYHNPNIPAYHARDTEFREHQPSVAPRPSNWGGERETPIQSRSFKYLQWITGTED